MTVFRVWAPKAGKVILKIEEQSFPMQSSPGGWWLLDKPGASSGADYQFVLDGGPPLPDPRSLWQPFGVHGPSRVLDQHQFHWQDSGWQAKPLSSAVIYELHIGTFTPEGTFEGAIDKLDHLVDLGITHIELMPVSEFPGKVGWGYDGVDLYAPHHAYGGPDGLKSLVDACHTKELAILLDVVYNHLGPDGNYLGQFGPYFTDRYETPWGHAINYDGRDSDEVRRFILDNAIMWLRDYHFDGLRLDAVHTMIDLSAVHILEQMAAEVDMLEAQLGRSLVLIAESDLNDSRLVRSVEAGGYGLDAQWSDDFRHSLHTLLTGERNGYHGDFGSIADLAKAIQDIFVYDGRYSHYRGRRHGRPPLGVPKHRFLGYLQNHDQIGNRGRGERSSQLLNPGQLKIAAAIILTSPFVPMLFMGEEWGASTPFLFFTDHQNPELVKSVRQGRIADFSAFGWEPEQIPDPQAPETGKASQLDWNELSADPHAGLLDWHCRLIELRRQLPWQVDPRQDEVRVQYDEEGTWMVIHRGGIRVLCNFSSEAQRVSLGEEGGRQVYLTSDDGIRAEGADWLMAPYSVVIFG